MLWVTARAANFSRQHRYTLGTRLEDGALEVLELLVEASYSQEKRELLRVANLRLERLRYLSRAAKDLRQISVDQFVFSAESLIAIGKEIGGWSRQQMRTETKGSSAK